MSDMAGPPDDGWRRELADAIRDPESLCRELGLDAAVATVARRSASGFPLVVPRAFAARMRRGDAHDPLLLQVLPVAAERDDVAGFTADPVGERDALVAPGLVRKYPGRALVMLTGACAVHCRYCFRRSFSYAEHGATTAGVDAALAAIAADPTITEVILSGGDPLMIDDGRLEGVVRSLDTIPHVRRLRIHTRLPVVLPSRVTMGLSALLAASRLARVVVIHANHARELDDDVAAAVHRIATTRTIVLNQAVLLAGVNDSVPALASLSERLVEIGVVPYYLHLLDRVSGSAHFEVGEPRARSLVAALRATLPGYAVPRLARETPGEPSKVWLA